MTDLPKTVFIGPMDYRVRKIKDKRFDLLGETLNTEAEILINAKQADCQARDSLLHEVLHAIIFTSGYSKAADLSHEAEERLVVTLSPWLVAFIQDNPQAVAYIRGE